MQVSGFTPRGGPTPTTPVGTVSIVVGITVTTVSLPNAPYPSETIARFVAVGTNTGGFISWYYGTASGLTAGIGCVQLCNTVEIFGIPSGVTQISAIAGATGCTLYIVVGDGL